MSYVIKISEQKVKVRGTSQTYNSRANNIESYNFVTVPVPLAALLYVLWTKLPGLIKRRYKMFRN